MNNEITIGDLLKKIGAMAVEIDIAHAKIAMLQQEIDALRALKEQKADAKTIAK